MRTKNTGLGLVALGALASCGGGDTTGTSTTATTTVSQQQAIVAMDFGTSAAAIVLAQFMRPGAKLQKPDNPLADSHGGDGDGGTAEGGPPDDAGADPKPTPDQVKTSIADDVSGAAPNACVKFAWTTGLTGTVTYANCQYGTTTVDGQLGLAVALLPTKFSFSFTDLKVDTTKIDGTASLLFGGTELAPTTQIEADLGFDAAGATQLALTSVLAVSTPTATTLTGAGSVTTAGAKWLFSFTDAVWKKGECHPSAGAATLDSGQLPVTITFLAKTPTEGTVLVQLGSGLPFEQAVLTPCS